MRRARRAGNALIHQGAAQIIRTGPQARGRTRFAQFYPGGLDIRQGASKNQPPHGVHRHRLPPGGAAAGATTPVKRRLVMHERQRDKFGKAASA